MKDEIVDKTIKITEKILNQKDNESNKSLKFSYY